MNRSKIWITLLAVGALACNAAGASRQAAGHLRRLQTLKRELRQQIAWVDTRLAAPRRVALQANLQEPITALCSQVLILRSHAQGLGLDLRSQRWQDVQDERDAVLLNAAVDYLAMLALQAQERAGEGDKELLGAMFGSLERCETLLEASIALMRGMRADIAAADQPLAPAVDLGPQARELPITQCPQTGAIDLQMVKFELSRVWNQSLRSYVLQWKNNGVQCIPMIHWHIVDTMGGGEVEVFKAYVPNGRGYALPGETITQTGTVDKKCLKVGSCHFPFWIGDRDVGTNRVCSKLKVVLDYDGQYTETDETNNEADAIICWE
jgi:hypothetical protein